MRLKSIKYPIFAVYELLRSIILLHTGALIDGTSLPVTWYAGVPLLCLTPLLFIILSSDEQKYNQFILIIALVRGLGIVALCAYLGRTTPDAIRFGLAGDTTLIASIARTLLVIAGDTVLGIYCLRRYRKLCK